MFWTNRISVVFFALCGVAISQQSYWQLEPFWKTDIMKGESVLFVKDSNSLPSANLLFLPKEITRVYSPSTGQIFHEGVDYKYGPNKKAIYLMNGSQIPFIQKTDLYKNPGEKMSINGCKDSDKYLFFSEGHVFHDLQVEVDYVHGKGDWQGITPEYELDRLPKTLEKLTKRELLKLVIFGDSISTGANASMYVKAKPFMPFYGKLVVLALENVYQTKIEMVNFSVPGMTSLGGVGNINKVCDENPDLVIIAWGMNDASGRISSKEYVDNISKQISQIRSKNPNAEFVVVATMYGNPEWSASCPELYEKYRQGLEIICHDGVILADVTSIFREILKSKKYIDITGNGVNHPNDFGHRIYAQTILSLLVKDTEIMSMGN